MSKPIRLTVGPPTKKVDKGPSKCYHEVTFRNEGESITKIVFRNYYCASLVVKQLHPKKESEEKSRWRTIVKERKLMVDPHFEDFAQSWHTIHAEEFTDAYDPKLQTPLRFYISQPSPHWRRFELRELACYRKDTGASPGGELTAPAKRKSLINSGLFNIADENVRNILKLNDQSQNIVETIKSFKSSSFQSNNPVSCLSFENGNMVHVSIENAYRAVKEAKKWKSTRGSLSSTTTMSTCWK